MGSTTAYTILEKKFIEELVLIDVDGDRALGEALDLIHCTSGFGKEVSIWGSSDYVLSEDSDLVVITAGIPRKPGDTRLDLLKKNTSIMQDIVSELMRYNDDAIFLVVSNPVDVMTYVAQKVSGLNPSRVFGLGTVLDSMRFRSVLSQKIGLEPKHVSALMMGEHGETMFPAYTQSFIKGKTISDSGFISIDGFKQVANEVRKSAAEVIRLKGATFYAPALAVFSVINSIIRDKKNVLPISSFSEEHGAYVSTLARVGGVGAQPLNLSLNEEESANLDESIRVIKNACRGTGL